MHRLICSVSPVPAFLLVPCPLLPTCMPFSAFQKSAYAVTASSPCVDGMSVSHTGAELLCASGICPDKDCLLSGECAPSTTASLLLKRHLCTSSCPFLHPEPSHALKDLIMALLHFHALHIWPFSRAAHPEHATAPCIQGKQAILNTCQNQSTAYGRVLHTALYGITAAETAVACLLCLGHMLGTRQTSCCSFMDLAPCFARMRPACSAVLSWKELPAVFCEGLLLYFMLSAQPTLQHL